MTVWDVEWFTQRAENVRRKTWLPWSSKKFPKRAVLKDGHKNVYRKKLTKMRRWRYLQDIFTTLLDAQWRWTLQFLALEFFGSWLLFALIWWLIAFVHGDLHDDHLPLRQAETGWTPCVLNIHGFHSAFLYSIETQHTTGYGLRVITEECPEAIFIMVCQCLIGMTLDSFAISIVFAKIIRSKHATHTVQFSRNAVISHRNGKLCFMFRVGDIRRSRLAGANVRAILIKNERTQEGEVMQNYQTELPLNADSESSNLLLLWPTIVYHEISEDSPLYDFIVPELMKGQKIEIIVILNATVESTGVSFEAKSSYLANEILWGYKFEPMVSYNKYIDCYEVDWSKFDNTRAVHMQQNEDEEDIDNAGSERKLLTGDNTTNFSDLISDELLPPLPRASYTREEMIDFEDLSLYFLPLYRKPSAPISLEKTRNKKSLYQTQSSRYEKHPETINESDENQELQVTLV